MNNESITPRITFLNHTGDVTISWDDENKDEVKKLIEKKMAQGFSFFIVRPAGTRGRSPKLKTTAEIEHIPSQKLKVDNKVDGRVLGDDDLVTALTSGVISIERKMEEEKPIKKSLQTIKRAETSTEVIEAQSIAMKPITAG